MKKDEIVRKNLDLQAEFLRYSFDHPDVLDRIPTGATMVILPDDDAELCRVNERTLRELRKQNLPTVVVRMPSPKPVEPRIEVFEG
ncbi:MAG: hypothetical protein HYU64_09010 [Armatimonadetes bacterium]|nr:hypothetical protein [Armatimonadota bacterium]